MNISRSPANTATTSGKLSRFHFSMSSELKIYIFSFFFFLYWPFPFFYFSFFNFITYFLIFITSFQFLFSFLNLQIFNVLLLLSRFHIFSSQFCFSFFLILELLKVIKLFIIRSKITLFKFEVLLLFTEKVNEY